MFLYLALLSCLSHSIDTCTVVIEKIRNMHAVSANQTAFILHFNNKWLLSYDTEQNMENTFRVSHILQLISRAVRRVK